MNRAPSAIFGNLDQYPSTWNWIDNFGVRILNLRGFLSYHEHSYPRHPL